MPTESAALVTAHEALSAAAKEAATAMNENTEAHLKARTLERLHFRDELAALINRYSRENESNTPDFILANYLTDCLDAFDSATRGREQWYDVHLQPGGQP